MPNFIHNSNSDPKVHQATSPYWVPTMHSVRVYQCVCNIHQFFQWGILLQCFSQGYGSSGSYSTLPEAVVKNVHTGYDTLQISGKTTNEQSCFCCYGKEDCKQSNQSWLHHYWNSYAVYSTISKVEPLPSVSPQIPVTNSTVNGTISGLDFCQCSYFHSCNFLFRSHFSSHWCLLPELWTCWCSATNLQ